MPDAELRYSMNEVKRAGKVLRKPQPEGITRERLHALDVFDNWQACHSFPLNHFYHLLTDAAEAVPYGVNPANVVQRRKRQSSIIEKLQRYPGMQLTTMQDIAGCRAIVRFIEDVQPFIAEFQQRSAPHKLHDVYDYIAQPKPSGYRSVHLVYKFQSDNRSFNGRFPGRGSSNSAGTKRSMPMPPEFLACHSVSPGHTATTV